MPQRFKLTIAYDGRPFSGWQSQSGGNTVQDVTLDALRSFCPGIRTLQGSGRTDAGVSADGQVAHFDVPDEWKMDATAWRKALNTKLPPTIRVMESESVDGEFHARFSAIEKTYCYRIYTGEVLPPLFHGLAWHQPRTPDGCDLSDIAQIFEGQHDFRAFSAKRHDGKDDERDTVRKISTAKATPSTGDEWELEFTGNGFLYKMVRFLTGAVIQIASNSVTMEEIQERLKSGTASGKSPLCAPAAGLRLVKVRYPLITDPH